VSEEAFSVLKVLIDGVFQPSTFYGNKPSDQDLEGLGDNTGSARMPKELIRVAVWAPYHAIGIINYLSKSLLGLIEDLRRRGKSLADLKIQAANDMIRASQGMNLTELLNGYENLLELIRRGEGVTDSPFQTGTRDGEQ